MDNLQHWHWTFETWQSEGGKGAVCSNLHVFITFLLAVSEQIVTWLGKIKNLPVCCLYNHMDLFVKDFVVDFRKQSQGCDFIHIL